MTVVNPPSTMAPAPSSLMMKKSASATASRAVKNVVVIGASYAGARAAELLAQSLPKTHRVILIDKNSHFNHIYRFVRFGVVPGHEAKAFIPYTNVFSRALAKAPLISEHSCPTGTTTDGEESGREGHFEYEKSIFVHANVVSLSKKYIEVDRNLYDVEGITEDCIVEHGPGGFDAPLGCGAYSQAKMNGTLEAGFNCTCLNGPDGPIIHQMNRTTKIRYDYLVYAAGSIMPRPLWSNSRTKREGMRFLQEQQSVISRASSVLIVGGGALGIQYATDIADLHKGSGKRVTLIHSRTQLLPHFSKEVHDLALRRLQELGVEVILGDRVILPEGHVFEGRELDHRVILTQKGRKLESDLQLFCTGQTPNTRLVRNAMPTAVGKDGLVKVHRTMQINAKGHNVPHIFAVGDCIDGFGAIKAGHTGWWQASVAAKNILKIVEARESGHPLPELDQYTPGQPMISLSLGLSESVKQTLDAEGRLAVQSQVGEDVDSHWEQMWESLGVQGDDDEFCSILEKDAAALKAGVSKTAVLAAGSAAVDTQA